MKLEHPHTLSVSVQRSRFRSAAGVEEVHVTVRPEGEGAAEEQGKALLAAYRNALEAMGWNMQTAVFRRFFCSDVRTLQVLRKLLPGEDPCAVSSVVQAPLPPARVVLWAYHVRDPKGPLDKAWDGSTLMLRRDGYTHCWTAGVSGPAGTSPYRQTETIFETYAALLGDRGLTLADHVVRTWLFVRDIDQNYAEVVKARRDYFDKAGLTPETHYIASTGIEGAGEDPRGNVLLDAYAVAGLKPGQVCYLRASDHLSRTDLYGVTFERGTAVRYADRTHITISGTASIDARGEILHPGDLEGQMDRALENIEALLNEAGAGFDAVQVFTVYLRRPGDRAAARRRMRERFGNRPMVVVTAPVCRPGWLIEIEGEALRLP